MPSRDTSAVLSHELLLLDDFGTGHNYYLLDIYHAKAIVSIPCLQLGLRISAL